MKKAIILAALSVLASFAAAADLGFGPRLGYTSSGRVDQFHIGGHMVVSQLTPNLQVIPSLEIGSGDGTLIALNGDLVYRFTELASGPWGFYGGGGPVLTRFDSGRYESTDFALDLVAGVTHVIRADRSWFAELRLGLEDAPDLKATFGLTFR
ncbi:MAG: hypothetical protein R3D98_10655 [Candidatus Krumholzibacteriia bacterium]